MGDQSFKTFPSSVYQFLAVTWLQQQDLHGKSAIEIADMYFSALTEIRKKYTRPAAQPPASRSRPNPYLQQDDW